MADYTYAYLIIAGFYLVLAAISFILFKKYRWPMLLTGLVLMGAGPIGEFFSIPDYWNPIFIREVSINTPWKVWKFGLEDMIGTIGFAAFSTMLFEMVYRDRVPIEKKLQWKPLINMALLGLAGLVLVIVCHYVLGMSGIHSSIFSIMVVAALMLVRRPAYIKPALIAAAISAELYWMLMQFVIAPLFPGIYEDIWNPSGRMGSGVPDVPVEEVFWAFFATLFAGPVYRWTHEGK